MNLTEINHIAEKSNITVASLDEFKQLISKLGITDNNVDDFIGKYCFIEIGSSLSRWNAEIKHVPPMSDTEGNIYSGESFYNKGQWYFTNEHPNVIKLVFDDNQKFNNRLPKKDGFDGKTYATAVKLSKKENIYNKDGFCFYYTDGEDFTDDKALRLKNFVDDNLSVNPNVKFIIHCMQGKSRSAAVGAYIANKIGQFNDDFLSEYDNEDESQFNLGMNKKGQPKYPHKNLMTKMGELEQWTKPKTQSKDQWFYDTLINHPKTGYNAKKSIKITEAQLHKLINEDVYMASKDDNAKKINLKYKVGSSEDSISYDKLRTNKMDTLSKDTYEIPLKGGLMSYNITSINGNAVMHYFKRFFNKQRTTVKYDKDDYELEMENAEFKKFMYRFLAKVNEVVKYKANQFRSENPNVKFTDFSVYPVPSSSNFNFEMAKRLLCVGLSGLEPHIIDPSILKKDFSKVKRDDDFINKNKDYYDSSINDDYYKGKTHDDNVNTVRNKMNAYSELDKRVEEINNKVKRLLKWWYKKPKTDSDNDGYYQKLYTYYMDYVNYIPILNKQNVYYKNTLTDKDMKLYFNNSIQVLKYTKGPSVEKRSKDILNVLKEKGFIDWHGRKKAPEIVLYQLKPLQMKNFTDDARMGLTDYFSFKEEDDYSPIEKLAENGIVLVFDDNISGGATLSDICAKLQTLGFKFIIPITFGKMHTSYKMGMLPISKPKKFNY